jgi:Tfp pilus assembly PilM family ATPase
VNFSNWFSANPEAVIEIEETYLRFLIPVGKAWQVRHIPLQNEDLFGTLKNAIASYLGEVTQAMVVLWNNAGSRILPFPATMSEREILEHLSLKKEDYFGTNTEMVFALKPLGLISQSSREYLVSFVNRVFFNRLVNVFSEAGCVLNGITTALETAIGRFHQQREIEGHDGAACIISLGYSQVNMIVLREGEVKAVRTSLTGSVKELEQRLADALKVKIDQIEDILSGRESSNDANTLELVQQNMRELLARITPFFAFIRSKEKESSKQTIFLSLPCLEIKGLKELLEKSFSVQVKYLDPETEQDTSRFEWLQGALHSQVVSLLPPRPPMFRFSLTSRLAWLFSLFFLCIPFGIININHAIAKAKIEEMRTKEEQSRRFMQNSETTKAQYALLQQVAQMVQKEIPRTVSVSGILAEIAQKASSDVCFTNLEYSPDTANLTVNGVVIDTQTGLDFWKQIKQISWMEEPKILFSAGTSDFSMGFVLSGKVKQ